MLASWHTLAFRLRFPQVRARPERAERHPRLDQELEEGHDHGKDAGPQAGRRRAVRTTRKRMQCAALNHLF